MRILLVDAVAMEDEAVASRYPPLQLAYLAAAASERVPSDYRIVRGDAEAVSRIAAEFEPDLVGITGVSQNFSVAIAVASAVKAWRPIPVIVGGHHVTALPESMTADMDAAVLGEGERTFTDLVAALSAGSRLSSEDVPPIPGLAARAADGSVRRTAPREPLASLDDIPPPARELVEVNADDAHMFSSRGCPHRCSFCSSSRFWKKVRYHSEERVAAEIFRLALAHKAKAINVFDDLFAANEPRLARIAEILDGYPPFVSSRPRFACLARADVLTPGVLALLKRIGVTGIALGFESGSKRVLQSIKGRRASVEANLRAADMIRNAGIPVVGSVIVGVPGETEEDATATIEMLERLDLAAGDAYLAAPYPGTAFWDHALSQRLVSPGMEWSRLALDFHKGVEHPVVINDRMSRSEVYDYWNAANRLLHRDWDAEVAKRAAARDAPQEAGRCAPPRDVVSRPRDAVKPASRLPPVVFFSPPKTLSTFLYFGLNAFAEYQRTAVKEWRYLRHLCSLGPTTFRDRQAYFSETVAFSDWRTIMRSLSSQISELGDGALCEEVLTELRHSDALLFSDHSFDGYAELFRIDPTKFLVDLDTTNFFVSTRFLKRLVEKCERIVLLLPVRPFIPHLVSWFGESFAWFGRARNRSANVGVDSVVADSVSDDEVDWFQESRIELLPKLTEAFSRGARPISEYDANLPLPREAYALSSRTSEHDPELVRSAANEIHDICSWDYLIRKICDSSAAQSTLAYYGPGLARNWETFAGQFRLHMGANLLPSGKPVQRDRIRASDSTLLNRIFARPDIRRLVAEVAEAAKARFQYEMGAEFARLFFPIDPDLDDPDFVSQCRRIDAANDVFLLQI